MNDKEMYSKLYDIFMENSRKMSDDTYIFNKEILLAGYGTAPDEIDVSRLLEIDINDLRYDAYVVATLAPPYIKETSATTKEEIIRELWDSRQMCHRYARFINNPYFKTKIRPIQTFLFCCKRCDIQSQI